MANGDSVDSWNKTLLFYASLTGIDWQHTPEFRELVSRIVASPQARGLTAITFHETLTVSPYTRYPDWLDGRRLELYRLADGRIRVTLGLIR